MCGSTTLVALAREPSPKFQCGASVGDEFFELMRERINTISESMLEEIMEFEGNPRAKLAIVEGIQALRDSALTGVKALKKLEAASSAEVPSAAESAPVTIDESMSSHEDS